MSENDESASAPGRETGDMAENGTEPRATPEHVELWLAYGRERIAAFTQYCEKNGYAKR